MKKICIIDDKTYGIPQVINAIPRNINYEFYYFDRITDIEKQKYDIIFLDYYLDKDSKTALDIIDDLSADILIGFSSRKDKNNSILKNGGSFAVKKLRGEVKNDNLILLLDNIL